MSQTTLQRTEHPERSYPPLDISIVSYDAHSWREVVPLTEASYLAVRALDFMVETASAGTDTSDYTDARDQLLTDIRADKNTRLTELQQLVVGMSVARLADQSPALLNYSQTFRQYAGYVAIAQLYDGRLAQQPVPALTAYEI